MLIRRIDPELFPADRAIDRSNAKNGIELVADDARSVGIHAGRIDEAQRNRPGLNILRAIFRERIIGVLRRVRSQRDFVILEFDLDERARLRSAALAIPNKTRLGTVGQQKPAGHEQHDYFCWYPHELWFLVVNGLDEEARTFAL